MSTPSKEDVDTLAQNLQSPQGDNLMTVRHLDAEFDRLAPAEWKDLPLYPEHTVEIKDENGKTLETNSVKAFMKRCETEVPTDDEILELIAAIQAAGGPKSWLLKLGALDVVDFEEGHDPTVQEFFDGNFDRTKIIKKTVIVMYPHLEK